MKQLIDLTDNQPIVPIAVQPKLDPNGGLTENDNGLAIDNTVEYRGKTIPLTSHAQYKQGTMTATKKGNMVQVHINALQYNDQKESTLASHTYTYEQLGLPAPFARQRSLLVFGHFGVVGDIIFNIDNVTIRTFTSATLGALHGEMVYFT